MESSPRNTKEGHLREIFGNYGVVKRVKVERRDGTAISQGIGFVELGCEEDANRAIEYLDGSQIDGRHFGCWSIQRCACVCVQSVPFSVCLGGHYRIKERPSQLAVTKPIPTSSQPLPFPSSPFLCLLRKRELRSFRVDRIDNWDFI